MILLLGGTSETAEIARGLAEAGCAVLVSTATDAGPSVGDHPRIATRVGRLPRADMLSLVRDRGIRAIVDATHPYATAVRAAAVWTADRANVPYMTFVRPAAQPSGENVLVAKDHEAAADLAFAASKPVLLTTGSRNLGPYLRESRRRGVPLFARVLDHPDSIDACRNAGLGDDKIIVGRGPFPVEENRAAIRTYGIGALVTKDSGTAGGVSEKLEAARKEGCQVVVVQRPQLSSHDAFDCPEALVAEVIKRVPIVGPVW